MVGTTFTKTNNYTIVINEASCTVEIVMELSMNSASNAACALTCGTSGGLP